MPTVIRLAMLVIMMLMEMDIIIIRYERLTWNAGILYANTSPPQIFHMLLHSRITVHW